MPAPPCAWIKVHGCKMVLNKSIGKGRLLYKNVCTAWIGPGLLSILYICISSAVWNYGKASWNHKWRSTIKMLAKIPDAGVVAYQLGKHCPDSDGQIRIWDMMSLFSTVMSYILVSTWLHFFLPVPPCSADRHPYLNLSLAITLYHPHSFHFTPLITLQDYSRVFKSTKGDPTRVMEGPNISIRSSRIFKVCLWTQWLS